MNAKISELNPALRWALFAALAGAAAFCLDQGIAAQRGLRVFPGALARPLPEDVGRFSLAAALADEARVAADWGYIECLQYMAGPYRDDGYWKDVLPHYREVQWLDPSFRHAVREGISVLGWLYRRPEEAETLARIAYADDRNEPRYAAYIAALAYQQHLDIQGVLRVLGPEAGREDAPEVLKRMYGNLLLKAEDWAQAKAYWTALAARSGDPLTLALAPRALAVAEQHLAETPDKGN